MTQDPRARTDSTIGIESGHQESSGSATALSAEPPKISELVQTLAAHGGGALSADLALDLVLNDLVQQARDATGATGATGELTPTQASPVLASVRVRCSSARIRILTRVSMRMRAGVWACVPC